MKNKINERAIPLLARLEAYGRSDYYPFHMPGHKRREEMGITFFPNPFSVDITEIEGFDNLHHAEGILKESMERAAKFYGADRTYYLVNGSTGGILSAVCGLTSPGGRIIMARNSHKSAYHALLLNQLDPVYIYPDYAEEFGIQGGIDPEKIEAILKQKMPLKRSEAYSAPAGSEEGIQAVYITSPTYEGMVSDIGAIAKICHKYGVPLIVDEAHGAHFSMGEGFPESAVQKGADVVIQSLHKTLPSLTQTAVLHVKSKLMKAEQVERYLSVFQSSSPSYVFLASIDNCIRYMEDRGREKMRQFAVLLENLAKKGRELQYLRLIDSTICGHYHIKDRDSSKLVISAAEGRLTGMEMAELLRSRFHLEPEMACGGYVLLMTSPADTEDGIKRLGDALLYMDQAAGESEEKYQENKRVLTWLSGTVKKKKLSEAWNGKTLMLPFERAAGAVSGGFITVYPPGVPMLVPGELITEEAVKLIRENRALALSIEGVTADGMIAVVDLENE